MSDMEPLHGGSGVEPGGLEDPRAPWEEAVEDPAAPRAMLAVMFTDIVGSTELATTLGDKRWRELLEQHDAAIREQIARYNGREVDTAGDAFFATFGLAVEAVDCALEAARAVRRLGLRIRAGVHMGECVVTQDKVRGVTVHIGARVGAKARGDEVLVSSTVHEILRDAGLSFEDRGEQTLKGVEGRWRLYAVEPRVRDLEADLPPLIEYQTPKPPSPVWKRPRVAAAVTALVVAMGAIGYVLTRGGGLTYVPADSVAIIDAGSGSITDAFPVGRRPVGVAAAQDGGVWVTNSIDRTVSHVAAEGGAIRRSGALGSGPAEVAIGPTAVWVANVDGRSISRVDPRTATEIEGARIQTGNGLSGMAYSDGAIWITNAIDGTVWKIDEKAGTKLREVAVGPALRGVAADEEAVWVTSETAGTLTKINPGSGAIVNVINVGNGARAVAIGSGAVWVANAFDGTLSRIDPDSGSVSNTIAVGEGPRAIAIAGGRVHVANEGDGTVSIVDAKTRRVVRTVQLGNAPMSLAAAGDHLWVSVRGGITSYRGGTLKFTTAFPKGSLDPGMGWDPFGLSTIPATHDGLVGFKKVGGVEGSVLLPDLAEEMLPPTDDGLTYSFTLRRGLRYSDGSAVRASDVRATFERMYLMDGPAIVFYGAIKGVDKCSPDGCDLSQGIVTDDAARTITFHLRYADPDFFFHLAHVTAVIVPQTLPKKDAGVTAIPGTGPYMMTNARGDDSGGEVTLVRNPHFRSRGAVQPDGYADRIVVRWGGSPEGSVEAVKRGDMDWTPDLQELRDAVGDLVNEFPAQVHIFDAQTVFYATLNPNIAPLNDVRVRRALNYAVDRRAMAGGLAATAFGGTTCQVLARDLFGYRPYCPYTKAPTPAGTWSAPDLATARRLIAEAGARNKLITIWAPSFDTPRVAAAALADAARSIGLRARIQEPGEDFFDRQNDPKAYQVLVSGWFADYPAPSNFILPLLACPALITELSGQEGAPANLGHFCSHGIDDITLRAMAEQQRNPIASSALWAQVDRAYVDAAAWIPFATFRTQTFVSARVGNVLNNPGTGYPLLTQMWLSDRK